MPCVTGGADKTGCDRSTSSAFLIASSGVPLLLFLSCRVNTRQALLHGTAAQRQFGEVPLIQTEKVVAEGSTRNKHTLKAGKKIGSRALWFLPVRKNDFQTEKGVETTTVHYENAVNGR